MNKDTFCEENEEVLNHDITAHDMHERQFWDNMRRYIGYCQHSNGGHFWMHELEQSQSHYYTGSYNPTLKTYNTHKFLHQLIHDRSYVNLVAWPLYFPSI